MAAETEQRPRKLTLREMCIGWGIVLVFPPLLPFLAMFAYSWLQSSGLTGWDWWAAVIADIFRFDPRWFTVTLLALHVVGLGLIILGCLLEKTAAELEPPPRMTRREKCDWGVVLILPSTVSLLCLIGPSYMQPPGLTGWDWWAAVFATMFRFPEPGWYSVTSLALYLGGLGIFAFGYVPEKHR